MSDPARPHFSLARTRAAARARWAAFRAMAKERADRTGLAASLRRPRIQLVLMLVLLPWLAVWASPLFLFLAIPAVAAIPVAVLGWDRCVALLARHYATMVIGLAILVSFGALAIGLWRVPFIVNGLLDELQSKADNPEATRGVVVALAAVLASITIIGTLIAQAIRVWTSERQTRTIEQGHVTDRLTKAIEQLGAEKTSKRILRDADGREVLKENVPVVVETTVPNLEVRLGAIYALERIAKDRDHQTIMEILCAYIRENAKGSEAQLSPVDGLSDWLEAQHPLRVDVQAAATVIGRRPELRRQAETQADFRLDLRGANLRHGDLTKARLEGANLWWTLLEGADLTKARLDQANLGEARMGRANLTSARLKRADLRWARMFEANLDRALMHDATLICTSLEKASLRETELGGAEIFESYLQKAAFVRTQLQCARLIGSNLAQARLEGVDLRKAILVGTTWTGTSIRSSLAHFTDFRGSQDLTQAQLEQFIGNEFTLLPEHPNEMGEPYYVWSCWDTPPLEFEAIVAAAARRNASRAELDALRSAFLCGPGNPRVKTGTPWPLDSPRPEGHPLGP